MTQKYLKIKISGLEVLIDVDDVQLLIDYTWHKHVNKTSNTCYMRGWNKKNSQKRNVT